MILIAYLLMIYEFILLARVLLSWFPNVDRSNPLVQFLYDVTEPVLRPVRELLPANSGVDFSPLVVLVIIMVIRSFLFG